jgi:CubicO group peptidase (beta-lactamase class C family)
MRLLKPSGIFRQDYGYCNSCFLTAGEIVPKVTGRQWENFVEDSIIGPLEMKSTQALSTGIAQKPNVAIPYTTSFTGNLTQVPYDNWNNLAPAASIVSNVSDLSHWLLMQLDSGRYNGRRILPFEVLLKTRDVNITTGSRKSTLLPVHFRGYGLGLNAADYNGRAIYWHTGGAAGMVSNVCFVPEERLGIAILRITITKIFSKHCATRYWILTWVFLMLTAANNSSAFSCKRRKNNWNRSRTINPVSEMESRNYQSLLILASIIMNYLEISL